MGNPKLYQGCIDRLRVPDPAISIRVGMKRIKYSIGLFQITGTRKTTEKRPDQNTA